MEISILIRKKWRKRLILGSIIYFGFLSFVFAQSLSSGKQNNHMVANQYYRSAFSGPFKNTLLFSPQEEYTFRDSLPGKSYTIQLFTLFQTQEDPILQVSPKLKVIRMGDLYRYIFSQYDSLVVARKALPHIRQLYPQACIREYHQGKLGPIVDMNIDNRINDKIYDAR